MVQPLRRFLADRHTWPLIGMLPMLVFAVVLLVMFARQQGRETVSEMRRHLEVLSRGVERRLGAQIALLSAMASLPWIHDEDFAPLKSYLESLRATYPAWRNVIVSDLERQIFNLNLYPTVAAVRERATIDAVVRSRSPVIGRLSDGVFSIRAPVERTGAVTKTIVVALHVSTIAQVFDAPDLPPGWGAVVIDARQDVIARTGAATASLARHARGSGADGGTLDDGVRRIEPDGDDLLLVSTDIGTYGWTVALMAPNRIVYAGGIRIDHLLYGAAALAALASISLLWLLSRSAHRRTEELQVTLRRLEASERRFRHFAETASDWFWETGPDHRYTFLVSRRSPQAAVGFALGRSRIEIARAIGGTVPEALLELERRMDRREAFQDFEYARPRVDTGELAIFEASGRPVFGEDGSFLGYRGTGRDVTVRKSQERELARALAVEQEVNAEQRRFIAIVSHEFRTPLTIIDGASQRILARLASADPGILKRLQRIRSSVARMTELIDRTLSSARLDTGGIEMNACVFDVVALIREVSTRQRQATPAFAIAIECQEHAQTIEGDPRLIDQVLTNLLSNAVKYSGESRRVDVEVAGDDANVEIAVTDRGIGIPADEMANLFTRFFRARTATGLPGTGIGLNLCRDLVHLHGGTILAESTVGSGSTFRIRLPRHRTQTAPRAA